MDDEIKELLKIVKGKKSKLATIEPDAIPKAPQNRISVERQKKVINFLKENELVSGRHHYADFIVYNFFLHWCRHRVVKVYPLGFRHFVNVMKVYIHHKTANEEFRFGFSRNLRDTYLTKQRESALRRWKKREKKKTRKEKQDRYEKKVREEKARKKESHKKK